MKYLYITAFLPLLVPLSATPRIFEYTDAYQSAARHIVKATSGKTKNRYFGREKVLSHKPLEIKRITKTSKKKRKQR
jgi:hypothetical protein